jgi:hypothetical protein
MVPKPKKMKTKKPRKTEKLAKKPKVASKKGPINPDNAWKPTTPAEVFLIISHLFRAYILIFYSSPT